MIPLRLSVKNFLCYREDVPTLDFQGIHVACLCGPNGHGKSALLDAITWSLWGEARGKTQDDLISYGADEVRVELEFLARDTAYRVIRSRSRGGGRRRQGVTDLQLQVMDSNGSQPITGNHIRETQAKIEQIIGMDYDAFINSAFLLQGRADEFTNKTPADRKAVLAKILGLEDYDRLQERARRRLDEGRTAAAEIEGSLGRMRQDVETIGDPTLELGEVKEHLDTINRQADDNRREVDELRVQVGELERLKDRLAELQEQIDAHRSEIVQLEAASAASQQRVHAYVELAAEGETIRQGAERLAKAHQRFGALEEARAQFDRLAESKNLLLRGIDSSRSLLEAQVRQLKQRVELDLPPKANAQVELMSQLQQARSRLDGLDEEKTQVAVQQDHLNNVATSIGEAQSTAERYRVEGLEVRAKLDLLQSANPDDVEAVCPLCQTPLGQDGCGRLAEVYQTDIDDKRNLYRQNHAQLQRLEAEKVDLEGDWSRREQALTGALREGNAKLQELEFLIRESREAHEELEQGKKQLGDVQTSLTTQGFAQAEHLELKAIEEQLKALGYDEQARQQSYAETRDLQFFEERLGRLVQAEANLPVEQETLLRTNEILQRRRHDLELAQQKNQTSEQAITGLPEWQERFKNAEVTRMQLESARQAAAARQGQLDGELQRLHRLRREVSMDSARLTVLKGDESIYQELVTAFGRQGIQAMLIETVVPRLEEEANVLLGRMTDNRMHVKLETQRQRRSGQGDPIETLEINVSDELGPRSYEMYSGGEAFRINLALRIALSKVLAQRMGAPLPTLFIDEGFGSQDAAGRERILDVIGSIENDFDKIIVVTHLDELKDAFPVRIEVQKGEFGSTFWIS